MNCPDENTIARIQAGEASEQERAQFHRHLDQCLQCMQLIEVLSQLDPLDARPELGTASDSFAAASFSDSAGARRAEARAKRRLLPRRVTDLLVTSSAMVLTQVGCSLLLLPASSRYLQPLWNTPDGLSIGQKAWLAWASYFGIELVVGPALALCGVYGVLQGRRWADTLLRVYAASAAATLVMVPMSACLILLLHLESSPGGECRVSR